MIARAIENGPSSTVRGAALRDSLIEAGVLPEEEGGAPSLDRLGWEECARDIRRLRQIGVRMSHGPLDEKAHRVACMAHFGHESPSAHSNVLRNRSNDPTIGDVCVLLADLAGPARDVELRTASPGRGKSAKIVRGKRGSSKGKHSRGRKRTVRR
jgi:hypothetical protein